MKTEIKNLFLLPALITGLGLILTHRISAQSLTILHNFTANTDGANPWAGLILSGDTLYGTTKQGGIAGDYGNGTVFKVKTNGAGYTILHRFTAGTGSYPQITNSDGAFGANPD